MRVTGIRRVFLCDKSKDYRLVKIILGEIIMLKLKNKKQVADTDLYSNSQEKKLCQIMDEFDKLMTEVNEYLNDDNEYSKNK